MRSEEEQLASGELEGGLVRRAIRYGLILFLSIRIGLSLLGLAVGSLSANPVAPFPGTGTPVTPGFHNVWDGTDRLDAAWFMLIAERGYVLEDGSAAFFPLYPLTIRAVTLVPGIEPLGAALIVANVAFLASLVLLYVLTSIELSEADARRAATLLAVFPTAFFLLVPYSESLFLATTLGSFLAVQRRRWVWAGLLGGAAAATRVVGIALIPAFLLDGWTGGERTNRRRSLIAVILVALGPALYAGWWWVRAGTPFAPLHAQELWKRSLGFAPISLGKGLSEALQGLGRSDGGYWVSDAMLTFVALAALVTAARWIRPSYLTFAALSFLIPLSYPFPGRDLVSISRFVLAIFPVFWGMAIWARRRWVFVLLVVISVPLLAWHALLFMHWRHIY